MKGNLSLKLTQFRQLKILDEDFFNNLSLI